MGPPGQQISFFFFISWSRWKWKSAEDYREQSCIISNKKKKNTESALHSATHYQLPTVSDNQAKLPTIAWDWFHLCSQMVGEHLVTFQVRITSWSEIQNIKNHFPWWVWNKMHLSEIWPWESTATLRGCSGAFALANISMLKFSW